MYKFKLLVFGSNLRSSIGVQRRRRDIWLRWINLRQAVTLCTAQYMVHASVYADLVRSRYAQLYKIDANIGRSVMHHVRGCIPACHIHSSDPRSLPTQCRNPDVIHRPAVSIPRTGQEDWEGELPDRRSLFPETFSFGGGKEKKKFNRDSCATVKDGILTKDVAVQGYQPHRHPQGEIANADRHPPCGPRVQQPLRIGWSLRLVIT